MRLCQPLRSAFVVSARILIKIVVLLLRSGLTLVKPPSTPILDSNIMHQICVDGVKLLYVISTMKSLGAFGHIYISF